MNVTVKDGSLPMSDKEIAEYVKYVKSKAPTVDNIELMAVGDTVDIYYHIPEVRFDRIRRITGYLVGTVDRWNDAKREELNDRVKHGKV